MPTMPFNRWTLSSRKHWEAWWVGMSRFAVSSSTQAMLPDTTMKETKIHCRMFGRNCNSCTYHLWHTMVQNRFWSPLRTEQEQYFGWAVCSRLKMYGLYYVTVQSFPALRWDLQSIINSISGCSSSSHKRSEVYWELSYRKDLIAICYLGEIEDSNL